MSNRTRHIIILIAAVLLSGKAHCQFLGMSLTQEEWRTNAALRNDSSSLAYKPYTFLESCILPAGMLAVSAFEKDNLLDRSIIKSSTISAPQFPAADWVQYSPAVLMYSLKACGVDGRNDWARMVTSNLISVATMTVLVNGCKYTVKRQRPDGSTHNSYPSGHTATSFMSATMLHLEYGETVSPWISALGFATATSVGVSRIVQDRHWISDVMAGASVGIFSGYLGYAVSDLLFADRRLKHPVSLPHIYEPAVWQFSMNTTCALAPRIKAPAHVCPPDIAPAYSVGVNADWMCLKYAGLSFASSLTQLGWHGNNPLVRPKDAAFSDLFTLGGGLVLNVPVVYGVSVMGRINAGHTFGHNYNMHLSDLSETPVNWSLPSGLRAWGQLGITYRTTGHTALTAFAGKEYYRNVWDSWTVGSSFNFMF